MILNTFIQGAVNARSQHVSVKAENAATTSRNQHTQANSSSVQHAWESFREEVDSDPVFARKMAEAITYIPNRMSVNLSDLPPLTDLDGQKRWAEQAAEFNKVAEQVTAQRVALFKRMKGEGASDAAIFNEMIAFNKALPMDYQVKAGMLSVHQSA